MSPGLLTGRGSPAPHVYTLCLQLSTKSELWLSFMLVCLGTILHAKWEMALHCTHPYTTMHTVLTKPSLCAPCPVFHSIPSRTVTVCFVCPSSPNGTVSVRFLKETAQTPRLTSQALLRIGVLTKLKVSLNIEYLRTEIQFWL